MNNSSEFVYYNIIINNIKSYNKERCMLILDNPNSKLSRIYIQELRNNIESDLCRKASVYLDANTGICDIVNMISFLYE